jgi:transposase
MLSIQTPLPENPVELKSILVDLNQQWQGAYSELEQRLQVELSHNRLLKEQIQFYKQRLFGKKSEVVASETSNQTQLFNEAEAEAKEEEPEPAALITVPEHQRKKRGRKPLPEDLPREEVMHDLPAKEKQCACCGKDLPRIGQESTEELAIIPEQVKVIRHVRLKYGPCGCDRSQEAEMPEVKIASAPARLIPHSIVSPSLLAYSITGKFNDGLPFYRQSAQFARYGVELSRATLCNWALLAAKKCEPLIERLRREIKQSPFIQMDETPLQVLEEPGRSAESKSYMWVSKGMADGKPIILYEYDPSRAQAVPKRILDGYQGYLQTDDYGGYDGIAKNPGIVHVLCWAHARRKFVETEKVSPGGLAKEALSYIRNLYDIEKTLRAELKDGKIQADDFVRKRKERVKPLLAGYLRWLEKKAPETPPESLIGKAIRYSLRNWEKLIRYLDAWYITPDNNGVENAIRPFVLGRKNWLFANTPRGACASASLYSLVETAKANGLEPYHYLNYLFTHLPMACTPDALGQLLPTCVKPEYL